MSDRGRLGLFACILPIFLVLAAVVPPADDEIYYWCWAQNLQLSYFDHPPMTAYMIKLSTSLFGDSLVAIRLPACLTGMLLLLMLGKLTSPRPMMAFAFLTPLFLFGSIIITPDTPLILFWTSYVFWLVKIHQRLNSHADAKVTNQLWLLGGLILGCGALSKYTMVLAVPAGGVTFLLSGLQWQRWLPGYIAHGFVTGICILPVLIFNYDRSFEPMSFQWHHASADESGLSLVSFAEFLGIQMLLMGTLPFLLLPWITSRFVQLMRDPLARVCTCMYALPLCYFLYKSMRGPLEGNWAIVSYLSFWPIAAIWYRDRSLSPIWQRLLPWTFVIPAFASGLLILHMVYPLKIVKPEQDRVSRQWPRMEIARQAAERAKAENCPVYCMSYQWTALLRYHGVDAYQIDGLTRPSHFIELSPPMAQHERILIFAEGFLLQQQYTADFQQPTLLAVYPEVIRGVTRTGYLLASYRRK